LLILMMVLSEKGIEHLDLAFATIKKWRKRNVSVPLFLTENYVDSSLDSFPIEYLNFQRQYLLIYGKDILKDLTLNWDFIRLQCEREIKGKLLVLRRTFLETEGKGRAVKGVIRQSIPAFIAIFEALLFLKGKDRPEGKRGLIRGTAKAFDMDAGVFERLLDIREGKVKPNDTEIRQLFKDYLGEVRKLSVLIDTIGG